MNTGLTIRNWLIGCYISEYEFAGADRAKYGGHLLAELAVKLVKISNCSHRQLYRYLRFYRFYPQILGTVPPILKTKLPQRSLKKKKVGTQSPILHPPANILLQNLSYSHIDLLVDIDEEIKRTFYEIECIRGSWSVRELKRQIASLYFERSELSFDKNKLSELANSCMEKENQQLMIRDPYIFEFLGLQPVEVLSESQLENQLTAKLEDFLLELGYGFCFEARQKRILIGNEHFFVDLVFYHRILKCHILIELKTTGFSHENIGQLNTYVSWFKKNMMAEGDNPPIGILLCSTKNHALVEYALAGMDNNLFVSKYMLELPQKDDMAKFLEEKIKEIGL